MDKIRIGAGDIRLGESIQWDIYDDRGILLLSEKSIVQTKHQLDELLERGMHVDAVQMHRTALSEKLLQPVAKVNALPSVVRMLNQCSKQLEKLLFGLHVEENAQARFIELAMVLIRATHLQPEIALAYILLSVETTNYTVRHGIDTAIVVACIARALKQNPDNVVSLVAAALTMNIGMLHEHNDLQGKNENLTEAEIKFIRSHPHESVRILKDAGVSDPAWLTCILHHHEQEDGSGYPLGKIGSDYPLNAKVLMLADRYCAGVTGRVYRKPLLPNAVLKDLFIAGRKAIDPHLAPYFIQEITLYPPGSLVRLQNGEIAVVTKRGSSPSTPIAQSYIGPRGAPLSFPISRNTEKSLFAVHGTVNIDEAPLQFTMRQLWGTEAAL